jgi:hypothetical protein
MEKAAKQSTVHALGFVVKPRPSRAVETVRETPDRWVSAAVGVTERGAIELDECLNSEAFRLTYDTAPIYLSLHLENVKALRRLHGFLVRSEPGSELRFAHATVSFQWDDEIPGRLFIWLNRRGKNRTQVTLSRAEAETVATTLAEADQD